MSKKNRISLRKQENENCQEGNLWILAKTHGLIMNILQKIGQYFALKRSLRFFLATPWLFLPISTQFTVCIRLHRLHTFLRLRLRLCPSPTSWSYCHYPCTAHKPRAPLSSNAPAFHCCCSCCCCCCCSFWELSTSLFLDFDAAVAFASLPEVLNIERTTPEANANIFVFLSISSSYFHFVPRTSAALPHTRTHTLVFFFL